MDRITEQPPFYFCGELVADIEAWSAQRGEKLVEVVFMRGAPDDWYCYEVTTTFPQLIWERLTVLPGEKIISINYRDPHA